MHKTTFILTLIIIISLSCEQENTGYKYNHGNLPITPVNLEDFNSEYDDYNSSAPSLGWLIPFCFSTNRNSKGENFDVIYQPMNVNFNKTSGVLTVKNEYANWGIYEDEFEVINKGLENINTKGNEFGPLLLGPYNGYYDDINFLLLYASDVSGNLDISFTSNRDTSDFSGCEPVRFLNSAYNDAYPTFNADFSRIYFCSDRQQDGFDIYFVDIDIINENIVPTLSDTAYHEVTKDMVFSSEYDDKCPYIFKNFFVFTSNRPAGYGGYDLYYSTWENDRWGEPVNFGPEINSEFDEYRPILFNEGVDDYKHMMVFSSNRPGGKGGFDLYFVGVDKK